MVSGKMYLVAEKTAMKKLLTLLRIFATIILVAKVKENPVTRQEDIPVPLWNTEVKFFSPNGT